MYIPISPGFVFPFFFFFSELFGWFCAQLSNISHSFDIIYLLSSVCILSWFSIINTFHCFAVYLYFEITMEILNRTMSVKSPWHDPQDISTSYNNRSLLFVYILSPILVYTAVFPAKTIEVLSLNMNTWSSIKWYIQCSIYALTHIPTMLCISLFTHLSYCSLTYHTALLAECQLGASWPYPTALVPESVIYRIYMLHTSMKGTYNKFYFLLDHTTCCSWCSLPQFPWD